MRPSWYPSLMNASAVVYQLIARTGGEGIAFSECAC